MRLPKKIADAMIAHAKAGYPNEACGILSGPLSGADTVSDFFPMRNMDGSSISYFMDPKEQLNVFKQMREKKLQMAGVFHSHVASPAFPSQKDVRLAFYSEVSYLIVSLEDLDRPVLKSFKIQDERVTEEMIEIIS